MQNHPHHASFLSASTLLTDVKELIALLRELFLTTMSIERKDQYTIHGITLFNIIWVELEAQPQFNDITELDHYFLHISKQLPNVIKEYCREQSLIKIPRTYFNIFEAVIHYYHVICKQRFFIGQLPDVFSHETFDACLQAMETHLVALQSYVPDHQAERELGDYLYLLQLLEIVVNQYGTESNCFQNYDSIDGSSDAFSIRDQLLQLPSVDEMNQLIDHLNHAIENNQKTEILFYKSILKTHMSVIEDLKQNILMIMLQKKQFLQNKLNFLNNEGRSLHERINVLESLHDWMWPNFLSAYALYGYKNADVEMKGYKELYQYLSHLSKDWKNNLALSENLTEQFKQKLVNFIDNCQKFCRPILTQFERAKNIKSQFNYQKLQGRELDNLIVQINSILTKSQKIEPVFSETLNYVVTILGEHVKSEFAIFKSYLRQHKKQLAMFGLGGCGSGALFGTLMAVNPVATLGLGIAGTFFGAGVGGIANLTVNKIKEASESKTVSKPSI